MRAVEGFLSLGVQQEVTRWLPHVERELLTLPEDLSSPQTIDIHVYYMNIFHIENVVPYKMPQGDKNGIFCC